MERGTRRRYRNQTHPPPGGAQPPQQPRPGLGPGGCPAHLVPGATLTEADYRHLRRLLTARNTWMRHLYDREIAYRGEIERFKQRFHYRMLRRIGQVVAPIGSHRRHSIDRWLGKPPHG